MSIRQPGPLVLNYLWDVWPNLSCDHKCRRRQRGSCLLRLWSPALGVIQLLSGSLQSGPHRVCIVLAQFQNARLKVNCDHCGEKLNHDASLHCWWRGKNTHQLQQPKDQSSLWSQDMYVSLTGNYCKKKTKKTKLNSYNYLFCIFILLHSFNWKSQLQQFWFILLCHYCHPEFEDGNGGKKSYLFFFLKIIPKIKLKINFKHQKPGLHNIRKTCNMQQVCWMLWWLYDPQKST